MSSNLTNVIGSNAVVLLVAPPCPFCDMAEQALTAAEIPFTKHVLTPPEREAMKALTGGKRSVPQGFVFGKVRTAAACDSFPAPTRTNASFVRSPLLLLPPLDTNTNDSWIRSTLEVAMMAWNHGWELCPTSTMETSARLFSKAHGPLRTAAA